MEWEPRENAAGLAAVVHSRAKQWIDMSHYTTIDAANNLERPWPGLKFSRFSGFFRLFCPPTLPLGEF